MVGYKMPPRGSGPTSRNRYKKLHFSTSLHFIPPIAKEASPVNFVCRRLEIMKIVFRFALLCAAVIFVTAQDAQEQERPKTFRRLIPADVLRGELTRANLAPETVAANLQSKRLQYSYLLLNLLVNISLLLKIATHKYKRLEKSQFNVRLLALESCTNIAICSTKGNFEKNISSRNKYFYHIGSLAIKVMIFIFAIRC